MTTNLQPVNVDLAPIVDGRPEKLQQVLSTVLKYILINEPDQRSKEIASFAKLIDSLQEKEIFLLAQLIAKNRITMAVTGIVENQPALSPKIKALRDLLNDHIRESNDLRAMRDSIVMKLEKVLTDASIDHLYFKTFNRFGDVGVDIDLLIRPGSYQRCIRALRENGFYPIDDLSKTFETGFMIANNPIIVDLHTDIAIMGITYFSPDQLFRAKCKTKVNIILNRKDGETSNGLCLDTINEEAGGALVLAHSVIKEGAIRASDLVEVYEAFRANPVEFMQIIEKEKLQVACDCFGRVMALFPSVFSTNLRKMLSGQSDYVSAISRSIQNKNSKPTLPITLPVVIPVLSLLGKLLKQRRLTISFLRAVSTLRFRRSVDTISKRVLTYVTG